MLKVGDNVNLKIDAIANGGEGIGRIDNFVVFVSNTAINDEIKVEITEVSKNFARGWIVTIDVVSPDRITPSCKFYQLETEKLSCGGCNFMHLKYEKQLEYKEFLIKNAFQKIGKLKIDEYFWDGIVASPKVLEYRNKLQLPISKTEKGEIYAGIFAKKSHDVVCIDECRVQPKNLQEVKDEFLRLANLEKLDVYDEKDGKGGIRHLCFRTNEAREILLTIVGTNEFDDSQQIQKIKKITKILSEKFREIAGIIYNLNAKKTNVIWGEKFFTIFGKNEISEKLCEIEYLVSSESFFQVNTLTAELLYSEIKRYLFSKIDVKLKFWKSENILDLYCGCGGIGIFVADAAKSVVGIESVKKAVENARLNAEKNNIRNIEFFEGKVEEILSILKGKKFDTVILNPPRKGISSETLAHIKNIDPQKIVYVSCNPVTLARDLFYFKNIGFDLVRAKAFDMFPQTSNVETLALLTKTV